MARPNEPLFLPKGSVRSILALGTVGAFIIVVVAAALAGLSSGTIKVEDVIDKGFQLAMLAMAFYFAARGSTSPSE